MVNTLNFIATIKIYYSWHVLCFLLLQDIKILLRCFSSRSSTKEKQRREWVPKIDWPNSYVLFDSTKRKIFPNHIFFSSSRYYSFFSHHCCPVSMVYVFQKSEYGIEVITNDWRAFSSSSPSLSLWVSMTVVFLHTN